MSRRVAVIIMAILTLLLGVIAVFIGLRLQQPDDSFVSGELGNPCVNNPSGVCTNSCAPGNLQPRGSCQPGLFCCTPTSTQCRPNQATCGGSNGSCCEGFVCQGTEGNQRCQPQNNCSADNPEFCQCNQDNAQCGGGVGGFISFVCNQLDNGECHQNPNDTHATYADAVNRVQNSGGCGQVDTVWINGPCNRQLCGGFTVFSEGCDSPTTTGSSTATTAATTTSATATTTTATSTSTSTATTTATSTPTSTLTSTATTTGTSTPTSTATSTPTSQPTTTSSGGVIGTTSSGGGTLPATALISDDVDRVLIAAVILVLGYLMLRFEIIDNLFLQVGDKVGIRRTRKLVVKNDRNED